MYEQFIKLNLYKMNRNCGFDAPKIRYIDKDEFYMEIRKIIVDDINRRGPIFEALKNQINPLIGPMKHGPQAL